MNTHKSAVESIFSGPVSENLHIYGIMQGVSIFPLSRFSVHVDVITVRHLNIHRTCQKGQRKVFVILLGMIA